MKKNVKRIIALLLAALSVMGLVGCGNGQQEQPMGGGLNESGELVGTFELQIFAGGYGSQAWEEIIAAFEEEHPKLDVIAYMDPNVNKQMQTRWIQGNPPDFAFLAGSNLPIETYLEENLLMDLTEFYETGKMYDSEELLKDHINAGLVPYYNGRIRQLPIIMETYGMWYDEALYKEYGLTQATNFDELMALSADAKAKGLNALVYPGQNAGYLVWGMVMPAVAAYGQEFFDKICLASDAEAFRDQRFIDVLKRLEQFADAGYVQQGTVSLNHIQSQMQWLSHSALMIPNGLWLENEMKKDIPDGFVMRYATSPLTAADQTPTIISSSATVGIPEAAKNKDAALEFLRFLYAPENIVKFTEMANVPNATDADTSNTNLSDSANYVQTVLNSDDVQLVKKNGGWGSVDSVFNDCMNRIVLNQMSAEEAAEKIAQECERQLADK